jgi:hypothetical protein
MRPLAGASDGAHRHRRVPFLDAPQEHPAGRVAGAGSGLSRCPVTDRRRKLGLADELLPRRRQVDQDKLGGGERITVLLLPADPPHPRPEKTRSLFLVRPADVEQIVRHPRIVWGRGWLTYFRKRSFSMVLVDPSCPGSDAPSMA